MDVIHRLQLNTTVIKKENSSQASKGIKHDIKKTSCKIDDDRGMERGTIFTPLASNFVWTGSSQGAQAAAAYGHTYENYLAAQVRVGLFFAGLPPLVVVGSQSIFGHP